MITLLSCLLALAGLQSTGQPAASPNGEIRGVVIDKESGRPLAGAAVRLSRLDAQEEALSTSTDEAGVFRFVGLAPGRYDGMVEAGQFRATHGEQSLAVLTGAYRPLVLKHDEVRELTVALTRTRAINVRVVDSWGDPLSGLRVTAQSQGTGRHNAFLGQHSTDDLGRLRIFGLRPGRYILCAEEDALAASASPVTTGRRDRLVRTCYPSAADDTEAEPVLLDRADIGELEIRMRSGHTFTISGRVLDASGLPAAGAGVNLSKFQTGRSSSTSIGIDADGRFRATNVQPGSYVIETSLGGPNRPELRRAEEFGFLPIKVEGADVEELVIVLKRGADVPGLVKLEDPGTDFPAAPGSGLMVLTRLAEDRLQGSGSTRIAMVQERAFTLSGMFGRRVIELANVPLGWYVKAIQYGGRDVIDEPIEFRENARASLEVLLSNRGAVVTGRVTDDRGDPVPRAMVFMIPLHQAWGGMAFSTYARASATGTFRIGPGRAGDYHIVALPASTPVLQGADGNRIARMAAAAERITISPLEERTVDLRLGAER